MPARALTLKTLNTDKGGVMNPEVDAYIAEQEPWKQEILQVVRAAVHRADPEIEELIKWGTPSLEHAGPVVWLFCASEWVHVSFRQGALLDVPEGFWEEDETTESKAKRTIKLRQGDEVPVAQIEKLVAQAVDNNLAGRTVDFGAPKPGSREFDLPKEYEDFLRENGLLDEYEARPYYQQKGWIQWIEMAKQPETVDKRMQKMLQELRDGTYMPSKGA
jgi:hypothetical protein